MEKNSAMTSFMIIFTSIIWSFSLLCKHIWSLHYIVFFVDFFRITVIKVWLLLVRGSTATGNDHLCDAWELFSRFSSTHVLISTLSLEVFDEKKMRPHVFIWRILRGLVNSSTMLQVFLFSSYSLQSWARNHKFLSENASRIFFRRRLYYTVLQSFGFSEVLDKS